MAGVISTMAGKGGWRVAKGCSHAVGNPSHTWPFENIVKHLSYFVKESHGKCFFNAKKSKTVLRFPPLSGDVA